ncbi:SET domain-containing protein 3 [Candida viswanathii]|uniref:SET domain-containing protein 3 n=1 Tax=Candida viswanathii TaxID=5486 RepID=A0A367YB25_9ASCO|nr:SET domain-containing protein 3 [Candida viswanathii]
MTNKDQEQLLQDASTLLMFANVAAKQLLNQPSPTSNAPSPPAIQQQLHHQQQAPTQPSPSSSSTAPPQKSPKGSATSPQPSFHDRILNSPTVPDPPTLPTAPTPPAAQTTPTTKVVQPRKSSISLLMNTPEPVPAEQTRQKSVSPTSGLPKKGSFKPNHERSKSTPEATIAKLEQHQLQMKMQKELMSPTPTYERGIDIRSKERNTKNAEIAAAALTAAADIPLPLKVVTEPKQVLATEKAQVIPAAEVKPPKNEEDQATEPEDDDEEEEQSKKAKPQEAFVAPPLSSYQVEPDSGLIGCICGIEDDDGFTIQCDVCFRWQHCVCMGYENGDEVPDDEYKCYYCDKNKWGKFDPETSRLRTLQRLEHDKQEAKEQREEKVNSPPPAPAPAPAPKRKQLNVDKLETNYTNNSNKRRKADEKSNASNSASQTPKHPSPRPEEGDDLPNKDNELLEDGVTAESYQTVYYNLKENDFKTRSLKEFIDGLGREFAEQFAKLPESEQQSKEFKNVTIMPQSEFNALKTSRINLPKYNKYLQEHNKLKKKTNSNKTTIQVKPYTDNQKQKFNGVSKLSLFIGVNSGEPLTIPENTPIIEYLGEVDLFKNYCRDTINQYVMWGTTKPKVLKTSVPTQEDTDLSIVLDSRFVGNESRFIRKSCPTSSNCKIQTVYVPDENRFRFMVYTSKPITLKSEGQEEELRLPWEWDVDHPILKLYENNNQEKFENLTNEAKSALITYIDNILHFVECGCTTSNNNALCAIFKIKKATSYLMRSTRKAASLSNINLAKSKDELILPRPERSTPRVEEVVTPDVEEEITVEKPRMLFRVPFRQQLLESTRLKEHEMEIDSPPPSSTLQEPTPVASEDDSDPGGQEIPIPVVPELMASIEKIIDEKLKPIIKEVEASTGDTEKLMEKVLPVEEKHEEAPATVQPKVVKKLSFADYKKMK